MTVLSSMHEAFTHHPDAYVDPDATVRGEVSIGAGSRIMAGARLIAEAGGRIAIGDNVIVMENAVIRATRLQSCRIGSHSLIGPNAHVVGATIEDEVFVATGAAIFHGAYLETKSAVRIHGVVHLKSRLKTKTYVPIGWIAVGDPVQILPPDRHDEIWAIQKDLDFFGFAHGVDRTAPDVMRQVTAKLSARLSPAPPAS